MAYPTAIGCGCLLGAGGAAHLHAAEWSMQPLLSGAADFDEDRNLEPGTAGSEQAILSADVRLQRAMESLQLSLEPHVDVRRYSDSIYGPGNDRSLAAGRRRGGGAHPGELQRLHREPEYAHDGIARDGYHRYQHAAAPGDGERRGGPVMDRE